MKTKHFLGIKYLTKNDIESIIEKALAFKYKNINYSEILKDKIIISIFFESSTRTRISFEIAAKKMGANIINIDHHQSSMRKGETDKDTIISLNAMRPDGFVVRHAHSGYPIFLKNFTDAAIINAGDGSCEHPSQAILDILTMYEVKQKLENLRICIIGDVTNSRVAKSHIYMAKMFNWQLSFYGPKTTLPENKWVENISIEKSLKEAVSKKDFIVLLRIQFERKSGDNIPSLSEYSNYFGIHSIIDYLSKDSYIMHPGPVNRNIELSSSVMDKHENVLILNQVENGVFARMSIYDFCLNIN